MANPLEVTSLTLGELQTNCYLAWCSSTREALIIDPADSGDTISQMILDLELKPLAIVLTHGHFDHVLATLETKINFDIPVLMHQADLFLIKAAQSSTRHWLKRETDPVPKPDSFLKDGLVLDVGEHKITVMETPGHTPGSIALYDKSSAVLFTGDTLFQAGVGRTDFSYSSPKDLEKSVRKLFTLPEDTICYPGHGPSTTIGQEQSPQE